MTITYDRSRRSGESVLDWALATRRVGAARADQYRTMLASGSLTETFVETLASPLPAKPEDVKASPQLVAALRQKLNLPTTAGRDQIFAALETASPAKTPARPFTAEGERRIRERLNLPVTASKETVLAEVDRLILAGRATSGSPAAAVRGRFVAAATTPTAPAGVEPGLAPHFAANPIVEQLAVGEAATFDLAVTERPSPPTLFAGGDLPAFTASGMDPAELTKVPWYARHAVAEATTLADAEALATFYSGDGGVAMAAETRRHPGNRDYEMRVWEWVGSAEEAVALREQAATTSGRLTTNTDAALFLDPGDEDDENQAAGLSMDGWAQQMGIDPKELSGE